MSKSRARRAMSTLSTTAKVGAGTSGLQNSVAERAMKNYLSRRQLLIVPKVITDNNPDKEFGWVAYSTLQKNGGYHPRNWRPFRTNDQHDSTTKDIAFDGSNDGLLHRHEMVLVWMPKEEKRLMDEEEQIVRDLRRGEHVFSSGDGIEVTESIRSKVNYSDSDLKSEGASYG